MQNDRTNLIGIFQTKSRMPQEYLWVKNGDWKGISMNEKIDLHKLHFESDPICFVKSRRKK
jgi:hypothetical protein